jgi:hypothetical protein
MVDSRPSGSIQIVIVRPTVVILVFVEVFVILEKIIEFLVLFEIIVDVIQRIIVFRSRFFGLPSKILVGVVMGFRPVPAFIAMAAFSTRFYGIEVIFIEIIKVPGHSRYLPK